MGHIRFLVKKHSIDKCEEIVRHDIPALTLLLIYLINTKKFNHAYSIFLRNEDELQSRYLEDFFSPKNCKKLKCKYLTQKLLTQDEFAPHLETVDPQNANNFLKLSDFGIKEENVVFINQENFVDHKNIFKDCTLLGLDSEFWTKDFTHFEQDQVALLQISSKKIHGLFDICDLARDFEFCEWLTQIFHSEQIVKVGHGFSNDMALINSTLDSEIKPSNLINIDELVSSEKSLSLQNMVKAYLNKDICKFNQMSAWNQRPLRKSQIHYAVLDSFAPLLIYEKIIQMSEKEKKNLMCRELNDQKMKSLKIGMLNKRPYS